MTFADLINNAIQASKERIKNPLISSFFCSFLIYNWRPITFLMFSEASFEDKIIVVNNEYCYPLAILYPMLFSILYTIYLPMLMLLIDENLIDTKKEKVKNLYIYKDYTVTEKMALAKKEFLLKNIESGNQDREDLIKERDSLKREMTILKNELIESNEVNSKIIKDLNSQMNSAINSYQSNIAIYTEDIKELQSEKKKMNKELVDLYSILSTVSDLDAEDIETLFKVRDYTLKNNPEALAYILRHNNSMEKLVKRKLLEKRRNDSIEELTLIGHTVVNVVESARLF